MCENVRFCQKLMQVRHHGHNILLRASPICKPREVWKMRKANGRRVSSASNRACLHTLQLFSIHLECACANVLSLAASQMFFIVFSWVVLLFFVLFAANRRLFGSSMENWSRKTLVVNNGALIRSRSSLYSRNLHVAIEALWCKAWLLLDVTSDGVFFNFWVIWSYLSISCHTGFASITTVLFQSHRFWSCAPL